MNIWNEIKESFHTGSNLVKLIYLNLAVFIVVKIVHVFLFLMNIDSGFSLVDWLAVPASFGSLILKPWTLFTYMFLHEEFLHILFNMLWLFWFGKIFLLFLSEKKLLSVYLLGGLSGAAFYIVAYNIFPAFEAASAGSVALGASASVMAIVLGAVTISPNFEVQIPFIGPVKIKWIAIVFVVLDIMQIPLGNAGGHIAHLGGAFLGYYYVSQDKKGKVVANWFDRFMDGLFSFFKKKRNLKVTHKRPPVDDIEYNAQKLKKQAHVDQILDKISKSGYDSLTKEEKDILFNMSNKN
ncbi:MAG: rhomboid family intramembrane serine protease [Bacteroidales bacterium]|nr:rhomboid family intramembrane serine protease [Bacteroidales bacterium]